LDKTECRRLGSLRDEEQLRAIHRWREQRGLPRWIAVVEADNRLPVDLENVLSLGAFEHEIKGRESVMLEEVAIEPDLLCVDGPDGHYTHEVVVPFVRRVEPSGGRARPAPAAGSASRAGPPGNRDHRHFPPGSEWVYAKLYTSPAAGDEILTQ